MRKTKLIGLLLAIFALASCAKKSDDPKPSSTTGQKSSDIYFKGKMNGTDLLFLNGKEGANYMNINAGFNKTANYASNVKKEGDAYFQLQYGTVDYETDSLRFASIFKVGKFTMGFKLGSLKPAYQFGYITATGDVYTSNKYTIEITSVADFSNKPINTILGEISFPVATQVEGLITDAYLVNRAGTDSVHVENVEFRTIMSQLYGAD